MDLKAAENMEILATLDFEDAGSIEVLTAAQLAHRGPEGLAPNRTKRTREAFDERQKSEAVLRERAAADSEGAGDGLMRPSAELDDLEGRPSSDAGMPAEAAREGRKREIKRLERMPDGASRKLR